MSYNLGGNTIEKNKILNDYLINRLGEYSRVGGHEFLKITSNKEFLSLSIPSGNFIDISSSFYNNYFDMGDALIIDIDVDSEKEEKLRKFLEKYVENDSIFCKGNPLYSDKREKELPKWQKALKRIPSSKDDKLVSIINDTSISTVRLKNTFFEYMVRPLLFFIMYEKRLLI